MSTPEPTEVRLLGGFAVRHGRGPLALPPAAQRLVAFLALRDRPPLRALVAGRLWGDSGEDQALGSLRSTLWRLRRSGCPVVETRADHLRLSDGVRVDVHEVAARARRVLDRDAALAPGDDDPAALTGELLPGWWDDWLVLDRERLRQLQLHALERLAERLAEAGSFSRALDAAMQAIAAEPLRESAHRVLIGIHLAEGNHSEALRAHDAYRARLQAELGVAPSSRMEELLARVRGHAGSPRG